LRRVALVGAAPASVVALDRGGQDLGLVLRREHVAGATGAGEPSFVVLLLPPIGLQGLAALWIGATWLQGVQGVATEKAGGKDLGLPFFFRVQTEHADDRSPV